MRKEIKSYVWSMLLSVIIFSALPSKAYAFVTIAIDPQSVVLNIKSFFTKIMESETVVKTIQTVKKTSAAIGTAKKTVTEYVLENKKKVEEELKKVQEYKEDIEEYVILYNEYKVKIEDGIATAKQYKEEIETGINTAKDLVNSAPDIVNNVKEQVKDKVQDKVSEVSDKLDISLPEDDEGTKDKEVETSTTAPASTSSASTTSTPTTGSSTYKPSSDGNNNNRQADSSNTYTSQPTSSTYGETQAISSRTAFVSTPSVSVGNNAYSSQGGEVQSSVIQQPSLQSGGVNAPSTTLKRIQSVSNRNTVSIPQKTKNMNINIEQSLSGAEDYSQAETIDVQETSSEEERFNKDIIPLASINKPEKSEDVEINIEQSLSEAEGYSQAETVDIQETSFKEDSPISKLKVAPNDSAEENEVKELDEAILQNKQDVRPIVSKSDSKLNSLEATQDTKEEGRSSLSTRKAFTTSSVSRSDSISFAKALILPDNGTDVNGTLIVPTAMALACGLSSSTALEKGAVDDCLVWLNEERKKDQVDSPYNAPEVFNQISSTYAASVIAEAYKALNDAEYFEENFVEPIQYAPDNNTQDTYSNIVELNKNIDMQMNNLLKIKSSILAAKVIESYYTRGFINYDNPEIIVADNIGKDNGTGADRVFKIPQQMALTCGLDSETVKDASLTDECFNTLANIPEKDGFDLIRDIILHQANKQALELALNVKSDAGDFEDRQEEALKDDSKGLPESPAAIGAEGNDEGAVVRANQEKNTKLAALSANNVLNLIDVHSMQMALDVLANFYEYDAINRKKTDTDTNKDTQS